MADANITNVASIIVSYVLDDLVTLLRRSRMVYAVYCAIDVLSEIDHEVLDI